MPQFSANLSMLFQEVSFLERFAAAAEAGFKAVEFMFPYDYAPEELKNALDSNGLKPVLFNLPAGNWAAGERGIAVNPSRRDEFREGVQKAIVYAKALGTPRVNCLVGKKANDYSETEQRKILVENLRYAADMAAEAGLNLLVEPINFRDMPGFFLNTTRQVIEVLDEVGRPNAFLQYDIYHAQRAEGELCGILRQHIDRIGHIQIADNPGRHQPGTGEINYRTVLAEIDKLGYKGYVGLEYIPSPDTISSLEWLKSHGYSL